MIFVYGELLVKTWNSYLLEMENGWFIIKNKVVLKIKEPPY